MINLFISIHPAFAFEPPHYHIQAIVDVEHKKISAQQKVSFTNPSPQPMQEIYFHIYPHRHYTVDEKKAFLRYAGYFKINPFPEGFQESSFNIQSLTQNEKPLSFRVEGKDQTLLRVSLNQALLPGETVQIDMKFTLNIPHAYGRLGWHKNIIALSRWYPLLSVYNEKGWNNHPFYPLHRPFFSEAAVYSVELTLPEKETVIHSGVVVRDEKLSPGMKTLFIESSLPIREFSCAMSPDYKVYQEQWKGVLLKSYYLSSDEKHAKKALNSAKDLMEFYTKRFGVYVYPEFSIAPVYLGYGGEQMSNMMFLDTRVYQLPKILDRYFDFLVSHETGHQWFYNMVGIDEYTQMWLEEGVHSYFILEYLENKYGANASILELPSWAKKFQWLLPELTFRRTTDVRYKMISRIGLDHPVVGELTSFSEPSSIFALTYGKGSAITAMLAKLMGPIAFERVFQRIFAEVRFKNLSVEDFMSICQQETTQDLKSFFKQWLYTKDYFDVSVDRVKGNKITVSNHGAITASVQGKAKLANGQERSFVFDGQNKAHEIILDESTTIKSVELDPDHQWLEWDRTNNTWPRRVNLKVVPFYSGLYDVPALMPDDSYNLVVGPELAHGGLGLKASFQKPYDQIFYTASDYQFSENILHSRVGYQLNNVFHSQTALGFEIANQTDYDHGDEDLVSGKVFIRRELWPVQYGFFDTNDHVSWYLLRNQSLQQALSLGGSEDARNISYLKRSEAIIGVNFHLGRADPYPDPQRGYKLDTVLENSGHFLGATQYFNRAAIDTSFYRPITLKSKLALRLKVGYGYPDDKNLFELGGSDGLRGYDRKNIRGSKTLMGNLEYRFPIKEDIHRDILDHLVTLDSIGGAIFFDAGQSWFSDFQESALKKDAGAGLRLTVNIGSFLEKMIVRFDVAQAINDSSQGTHFWFGVNQAF